MPRPVNDNLQKPRVNMGIITSCLRNTSNPAYDDPGSRLTGPLVGNGSVEMMSEVMQKAMAMRHDAPPSIQ
jgi:hypothetical protein